MMPNQSYAPQHILERRRIHSKILHICDIVTKNNTVISTLPIGRV